MLPQLSITYYVTSARYRQIWHVLEARRGTKTRKDVTIKGRIYTAGTLVVERHVCSEGLWEDGEVPPGKVRITVMFRVPSPITGW